MKTRHIIMISIIIIVILVLFGNRNIEAFTCTTEGNMQGMPATTTLKVKIKDDKVKDMNMEIIMELSDEYSSQKQNMINYINSQGKMKATSINEGIKLTSGMNSNYFDQLGLNKNTSTSELKEALEIQGYKCK